MDFLEDVKTVAIVGLSRDPKKPSHEVAEYLKKQGITVIPVNPYATVLIKEKTYASIVDIPRDIGIDVAAIYRKSEDVVDIIEQIVKRGGIKTIWLPQGAENMQAETFAFHHGITVVTNFCLLHEYQKLVGKKRF